MPKVTVVIPAYNAMAYLPETLDSVLSQTFRDFEVLIINDGSTDAVADWAAEIQDPRVRLISQDNKGLSGARNRGITESQGEYIAFLDADDLWAPTKLEQQVKCLDTRPEVGMVYTWTLHVDQQGNSLGRVTASHVEGKAWEQLLLGDSVGSGSSTMVRRDCFDKVGLFDTNLTSIEDCDMWVRLAQYYPLAVIKDILVYYRQHPASMSRDYEKIARNSRLMIEKKFANVPFDMLYLRPRAYGHTFLWLAWKVMTEGGAKETARYYARHAILHYPQMRFSTKYLRLQVALALGEGRYSQLRDVVRKLRGQNLQYHQL